MALAERRGSKAFQDNHWSKWQTEIQQAAGSEVPIEVDWASLENNEGLGHRFVEDFPNVYFRPLAEALRTVAYDDLGREAVKEKIEKIRIQNTVGTFTVTYDIGTKTLLVDAILANVDYWEHRRDRIKEVLEETL